MVEHPIVALQPYRHIQVHFIEEGLQRWRRDEQIVGRELTTTWIFCKGLDNLEIGRKLDTYL